MPDDEDDQQTRDDGDVANTYLKIVDPDGGQTYEESFQDFTSKYEAMADATGWNLQMMHY